MRAYVSGLLWAVANAVYRESDDQFQRLPVFLQLVLREQKKALIFVFDQTVVRALDGLVIGIDYFDRHPVMSPPCVLEHSKNASSALPNFLSYCVTDPKAPRIFHVSSVLLKGDFLPVLGATYLYQLIQSPYELNKEVMPEWTQFFFSAVLGIANIALYAFLALRLLQFTIRTAVVALEFPKAFHKMQNTSLIDNDICKSCNALRYASGDLRSILLGLVRLAAIGALKNYPVLNWIGYFLRIVFSGQTIAEYRYASANVCERHRWVNYNAHAELFFALGALHQLATMGSAYLISQIFLFSGLKLELIAGNVLFIPTLLRELSNTQTALHEFFLGGVILYYMVGLTYYMPFPKNVNNTKRWVFDFGLRWLTEMLIDFAIFSFKKTLKQRDEVSQQLSFRSKINTGYERGAWLLEKIAAFRVVRWVLNNQRIKTVIHTALPNILTDKKAILSDPVCALYTRRFMAETREILVSIQSFRPTLLNIFEMGKELDAIFSRRAVKWALKGLSSFIPGVGFLLPKIGEILTADFVMNKAPKYLSDAIAVCHWMYDIKLLDDELYAKYSKLLSSYEKNIAMMKRILNEIPGSMIDEFFKWMESEECSNWITTALTKLDLMSDQLAKDNEPQLKALGFDPVSAEEVIGMEYDSVTLRLMHEYEPRLPSTCSWPSQTELDQQAATAATTVSTLSQEGDAHAATAVPTRKAEKPSAKPKPAEVDDCLASSGEFDGCDGEFSEVEDDGLVVSSKRFSVSKLGAESHSDNSGHSAASAGVFGRSATRQQRQQNAMADVLPGSAKTATLFRR